MAELSLSKAWEESRAIFSRDGRLLTAVALALLVLPGVIAGVIDPQVDAKQSSGGRVIALAAAFIGVIGQLALIRLALGPSTTVAQAIGHGVRRFPATFGALVLLVLALALVLVPVTGLLLAAGIIEVPVQGQPPSPSFALTAILLAVAALFIAVKFMMSVPVASAEDVGSLGIIKRSWKLTKASYWTLFWLEVLLLVAAVTLLLAAEIVGGTLARVIGGGDISPLSVSALILALLTGIAQAMFTVLASVMLARVYVQLAGSGQAEVSVPSSGT